MCIYYPMDENKQPDWAIWKFQSAAYILEKLPEVPTYYYCTIITVTYIKLANHQVYLSVVIT